MGLLASFSNFLLEFYSVGPGDVDVFIKIAFVFAEGPKLILKCIYCIWRSLKQDIVNEHFTLLRLFLIVTAFNNVIFLLLFEIEILMYPLLHELGSHSAIAHYKLEIFFAK